MATKKSSAKKRSTQKGEDQSDPAVSYDDFKEFEGKKYTGMKVGRGHKWYYDAGVWKEKKVTPDVWTISYAVNKRRAGRAPEGSGVPVGTEYHWYILAHQNVKKLNANDYTTSMAGVKFKVAHKRADSEKWSATEKTQRKRMIQFLKGVIEELEGQQAEEEAARSAAKETKATKATGKETPPERGRVGKAKTADGKARARKGGDGKAIEKPDGGKPSSRTTAPGSMRKPARPRRQPVA